jgi:hypothetical protein
MESPTIQDCKSPIRKESRFRWISIRKMESQKERNPEMVHDSSCCEKREEPYACVICTAASLPLSSENRIDAIHENSTPSGKETVALQLSAFRLVA